jgi:hypothetical protein
VLGLACLLLGWGAGPASADLIDPVGDTFNTKGAKHDLVQVTADFLRIQDHLQFIVTFAGPISPPSAGLPSAVGGYIDIDTDQNPNTPGSLQAAINAFMPPVPPPQILMDADFFVDLYTEQFQKGFVDVLDANFNTVATVPIFFEATSFSFAIPLSALKDEGWVNYSVLVGNFGEPGFAPQFSDRGPNTATPATSTPEPTSLIVFGVVAAAAAGWGWRRRK